LSPYYGRRATYEIGRRIEECCRELGLADDIRIVAKNHLLDTIDKFPRAERNACALALTFYTLRETGNEISMEDFRKSVNSAPIFRKRYHLTYSKDLWRWYNRIAKVLGEQPQESSEKLHFELSIVAKNLKIDARTRGRTEEIASEYMARHQVTANVRAMIAGALAYVLKRERRAHSLKHIAAMVGLTYARTYPYFKRFEEEFGPREPE